MAILQNGLAIAFIAAVLLAWFETAGPRQLIPAIKRGLILALLSGIGVFYGVETSLEREPVEGILSLLAVLSAIALALGIVRSRNRIRSGHNTASPLKGILISLATAALVTPLTLDVISPVSEVVKDTTGLISTELVTRLALVLLILASALLLSVILQKVFSQVRKGWLAVMVVSVLIIAAVQEGTTVLQIGLVRGIIPSYDWLFRLTVFLINNYSSFYYGIIAAIAILILAAFWEQRHHRDSQEGLNPAQSRKLRAGHRRRAWLTIAAAALLVSSVLIDSASTIYASRPLQLSAATPVAAEEGMIKISFSSLEERKLYRFSYQTADGVIIRFMAIHKGSGIYDVALDACAFCGVAGYRQDGENVICNRCQAAINIVTIGFPGGCNPIPIDSEKSDDSLIVTVKTLEKSKGIFAR